MKKTTKTKAVRKQANKRNRAIVPAAFAWGEASLRGLQRRIEHLDMISGGVIRGRVAMTKEQFAVRLASIEAQYAIAFESATTLDVYGTTADMNAKQRRMNVMVELMILQLEEESGVTLSVFRGEEGVNHTPFPPRLLYRQTMLNWDARR